MKSRPKTDFDDVASEPRAPSLANLTGPFATHDLVLKSRKDLILVPTHVDHLCSGRIPETNIWQTMVGSETNTDEALGTGIEQDLASSHISHQMVLNSLSDDSARTAKNS